MYLRGCSKQYLRKSNLTLWRTDADGRLSGGGVADERLSGGGAVKAACGTGTDGTANGTCTNNGAASGTCTDTETANGATSWATIGAEHDSEN